MSKRTLLIVAIVAALPLAWLAYNLAKDAGATGLKILNTLVSVNAGYSVERDIAYGDGSHQKLDVYRPKDSAATKPLPTIVFFYGGGWTWGKKAYFEFIADAFTRHGYIVVIPDYVLYPQGKYPEFIADSAKATAWTHQNIQSYGGNPNLLVLAGHSAGAYNAVMISTFDDYLKQEQSSTTIIKAVAGVAGPYNFTPKAERYVNIFGEDNFDNMKIKAHVNGNEPNMLLLHGSGDTTVAHANQTSMAEALRESGVDVQTHLYSDELTHVRILLNLHPWFASKENVGIKVIDFFDEQLK